MIEIKQIHLDYSCGQHEYRLEAILDGKDVGCLRYSVYKDEVHVSWIEATARRQGVGTALLMKLQELYPETMIDFGYLTEDGAALMNGMEWRQEANEVYVAAAHEHGERTAKLQVYEDGFASLANASSAQKRAFLEECADWDDISNRIDDLAHLLGTETPTFRLLVGPLPKTPQHEISGPSL